MYKLLVADDETRDRNIVRILVEKQYPGLFEILEAKSGTQALEVLRREQIDLLVLDMNMPGLSGMSVIRVLPSPVYVIILTAYSFFDYAREALHYGVKDYVLKPPIRSELYGTIDRFLREYQQQAKNELQGKRALFQELATQLLFYSNSAKIENYCRLLDLRDPRISLAVFLLDEAASDEKERALETAERALDNHAVPYTVTLFRRGIAVLFFWNTAEELETVRKTVLALEARIGGEMRSQLEIASYAEVPRVFIQLCGRESSGHHAVNAAAQTESIESALRGQDFPSAMRCITEEVDRWDYQTSSDAVKLQLVSILSAITKRLFANADKRGAYTRLSALLGAADKEQLMHSTAEYLHWLISEINASVYTNSYVVHRVIDAVKMDCAKGWTMEGLASDLNISPYYLSHLFKEYTGSSFTDYLAECRIERAVELMKDPELTLAQIGDMVGYADQNYFSRVFKKRRGVGARQFRKQLLSE